jgi:hypothetical protein
MFWIRNLFFVLLSLGAWAIDSADKKVINSLDDVVSRFKSFPGSTSLTIMPFDGQRIEFHSQDLQPLGSGFKLYVLAALADAVSAGQFVWADHFPIREEYKSLPSGIMHTNHNGELFSLYDFAEHMIKISDNTATDHLISIVGRTQVEAQVVNNKYAHKNLPFLMTAEMFKIKWAAPLEVINAYVGASEMQRRAMLENVIKNTSLSAVGTNGNSMEHPSYVRNIEWFGTTNDLCQLMKALKEKNSPQVLKALSQKVPFVKVGAGHHWKYAGFKGGCEPGVITGTYLLQDHNDHWISMAIAWHHETQNLDHYIFFDLVEKILKLIEQPAQETLVARG